MPECLEVAEMAAHADALVRGRVLEAVEVRAGFAGAAAKLRQFVGVRCTGCVADGTTRHVFLGFASGATLFFLLLGRVEYVRPRRGGRPAQG